MPLMRCSQDGKIGWRWGESGVCYLGPSARQDAIRQGRAMQVGKQRRGASVGTARRRRDTRGRPFERALELWMLRYARAAAREETSTIGTLKRRVIKMDDDLYSQQLARLMRLFGLRTLGDAANRSSGQQLIEPSVFRDAVANKPVKIKWFYEWRNGIEQRVKDILDETKQGVRDSVQQIIAESMAEVPRPSAGEVARRIRTQFHGKPGERIHAFSPERAALIARTETVQAENTGIVEGYRETGVQEIQWLAFRDGKSGDRHHERMHNAKIPLGGKFHNKATGVKLRYPGDPSAPISETANCRCTVVASRTRSQ